MSCAICNRTDVALNTHRIVPGRLGGRYEPENTILLCKSCHTKEDAKLRAKEGYVKVKHPKRIKNDKPGSGKGKSWECNVKLECYLCGHNWQSRTENPKMCPRCKRYDWAYVAAINNVAYQRGYAQ